MAETFSIASPVSLCRYSASRVLGGLFLAHSPPYGPKAEHLEQTNFHSNSCNFISLQLGWGSLTPNSVPLDPSVSCSRKTFPPRYYISKGKTISRAPVFKPFSLLHTVEEPYYSQPCRFITKGFYSLTNPKLSRHFGSTHQHLLFYPGNLVKVKSFISIRFHLTMI